MLTNKAQSWTLDYVLGLLIFLGGTLIAIKLLINYFPEDSFGSIYEDGNAIADQVMSNGFPEEWNENDVIIPSFFIDRKLEPNKVREFQKLDYSATMNLLSTRYDYTIHFENENNIPLYFYGDCVMGTDEVSASPENYTKVAYYFPTIGVDRYMAIPLNDSFDADFYYRDNDPGDIIDIDGRLFTIAGSLDHLMNNISKYHVIFMENPDFPSHEGENITFNDVRTTMQNWVSAGNILYMSENVQEDDEVFFDILFNDTSSGGNPLTIINDSTTLPFNIGEELYPSQRFLIHESGNETNFTIVGNYSIDSEVGIATWKFGEGQVYYFADLDINYDGENNISAPIVQSMQQYAYGFCDQINLPEAENSVRIRRLAVYDDRPVYVVVNVWN